MQKIDETCGNPLREWEAIGSPTVPSREQVELIKDNSRLKEEKLNFTFDDNVLSFEVTLRENDIYFVSIK